MDYLWNAIRVQGGAYGAGINNFRNGNLFFYTFRDPNAAQSLDCFDKAVDFVKEFFMNGNGLDKLITGSISDSEPLSGPNGNIYVGVNVYAVHGSCAEYIAMGTAITAGEREFDTIVAVRSPEKNNTLISPCGNCRQMLMQYAPDIKVLIQTEDGIQKVCIKELLPYSPY